MNFSIPARPAQAALLAALLLGTTFGPAGAAPQPPDGSSSAVQPEIPCATVGEVDVRTEAVFSDPLRSSAGAVTEQLCALITQADPGSTIHIAAFVISGAAGEDYVDTLLAAHQRGVNVCVVLDGWQDDTAPAARLIQTLGTDTLAPSWVAVCSHLSPEGNTSSCQGTKGQHNKFHLFSSIDGTPDVVVQSSANVTNVNHVSYWNNALVVTGNPRLYDAYASYHADLSQMEQDSDYHRVVTAEGLDGLAIATFFPAAQADPILERLEAVTCQPGHTRIDLGISEWDSTRVGIAERLGDLQEDGCDVRIVHGPTDTAVTDELDSAQISRRVLDGSTDAGRLHSKYLVVSGAAVNGLTDPETQDFVLTGSHNYNHTSLRRNDEAILELRNTTVAQDYHHNADRLWEVATTP